MEATRAFPDGEWESFSRMFTTEDLDFTLQFLGDQCSFPLEHDEGLISLTAPSSFSHIPEENVVYSLNNLNSSFHSFSQESSNYSDHSVFIPNPSNQAYYFTGHNHIPVTNDISMSMDICMGISGVNEKNTTPPNSFVPVSCDIIMEETALVNEDMINDVDRLGNFNDGQSVANVVLAKELPLKMKFDVPESLTGDRNNINSSENGKKKLRVSKIAEKSNTKKNVQSKKNQKLTSNGSKEDSNAGSDGQSSSSCTSEDDNASQETNGGATSYSKASAAANLNGKTKATRGTATDPQSLYARKRRERTNERLRILQNLVPNGTKVDISTMLEEAVHYVKFLQLQIKLLSSDDMWMYAPIACSGIDIGLHQKVSSLL